MTLPETVQVPPPVPPLSGKVSVVAIRQALLIASGGAMVDRVANQDWVGAGLAVAVAACVVGLGWLHEYRQHRKLKGAVDAFWAQI